MAIWILEGELDGMPRVALCDSVTERPLQLPLFRDEDEAEDFLRFAREHDMGDVRALGPGTLDRLHTAWINAQEVARHDVA